jgi:sugar lactone lactonase YvrE
MHLRGFLFGILLSTTTLHGGYVISIDSNQLTTISFTNNFYEGVCTVEGRAEKGWVPLQNFFTTQRISRVTLALPTNYTELRLKCVETSPRNAARNLAQSYGSIHTIAGIGEVPPGTNAWLPAYEGAYATNVPLSNPRYAAADEAGNIYVVERGSHAVDKITPDGRIQTFVGTRRPGDTGFLPNQIATNYPLRAPSAIYLSGGYLWILDAGNNRIVAVSLDRGLATAFASDFTPKGIAAESAGLWVKFDATSFDPPEAFYGNGSELKHLFNNSVSIEATGFLQISDVTVDPDGRTIVTDRVDNRVYRVRSTGSKTAVAGTGFPRGPKAGEAARVALPGASSVAYLPVGGFLVSLDDGARILYVDVNGRATPFVFGKPGVNRGDEDWFRAGGTRPKISNVRSVSVAPNGDIIILEREGIVRKIDFLRHRP